MKSELFHVHGTAMDKEGKRHVVTVVGVLDTWRERVMIDEEVKYVNKANKEKDAILIRSEKVLKKKLTMSFSICHPLDEFSEGVGIGIAKKRIKEGKTLGTLETTCLTMLHEKSILAILNSELENILTEIESSEG